MGLKLASLAGLGAMALALPAAASTDRAGQTADCPNARLQMHEFGAHLKQLDGRLDRMGEALAAQKDVRRAAVDEAVAAIEQAVRQPGLSQDQIDAVVAGAVARAELKSDVGASAAEAAESAIRAMEPQLQALEDRISAMSEDSDLGPDPAPATD